MIISSSCRSISSSHFGGIRLALSLIGVALPVSILCLHMLVQSGFFGSTANKSLFSSKSLASSLYSCFSHSGAISKSSLPAPKLDNVLSRIAVCALKRGEPPVSVDQWFSTGVPRLKLKGSAGLLANIDVNTPEIGNAMFSNLLTTM